MGRRRPSVETIIKVYEKIGWTRHPEKLVMVNSEGEEVSIIELLERKRAAP